MDVYTKALVALCKREGGHEVVATNANCSAPYLWQILHGTLDKKGNPREMGVDVRKRITAAYPDWLTLVEKSANSPFGLALADLFDGLPNDQLIRTKAWNAASAALIAPLQVDPPGDAQAQPVSPKTPHA